MKTLLNISVFIVVVLFFNAVNPKRAKAEIVSKVNPEYCINQARKLGYIRGTGHQYYSWSWSNITNPNNELTGPCKKEVMKAGIEDARAYQIYKENNSEKICSKEGEKIKKSILKECLENEKESINKYDGPGLSPEEENCYDNAAGLGEGRKASCLEEIKENGNFINNVLVAKLENLEREGVGDVCNIAAASVSNVTGTIVDAALLITEVAESPDDNNSSTEETATAIETPENSILENLQTEFSNIPISDTVKVADIPKIVLGPLIVLRAKINELKKEANKEQRKEYEEFAKKVNVRIKNATYLYHNGTTDRDYAKTISEIEKKKYAIREKEHDYEYYTYDRDDILEDIALLHLSRKTRSDENPGDVRVQIGERLKLLEEQDLIDKVSQYGETNKVNVKGLIENKSKNNNDENRKSYSKSYVETTEKYNKYLEGLWAEVATDGVIPNLKSIYSSKTFVNKKHGIFGIDSLSKDEILTEAEIDNLLVKPPRQARK